MADTGTRPRSELERGGIVVGGLLVMMWVSELIDTALDHRLDRYGVVPHRVSGLRGIVFAPFLHSGFRHLLSNTIPFAVMGFLVVTGGLRRFVSVSVLVMAVSGAGMWALGSSNEVHIGASGVVFGYLGYLLSRGFFERRLGPILLGVAVGVIYGGLIWGVLPVTRGVSWQGHLFGFIGGVVAARVLSERRGETTAKTA